MTQLVNSVASVSTMWSLAAFGIVGVLYLVLKRNGKVPPIGWVALIAIAALAALPIVGSLYVQARQNDSAAEDARRKHNVSAIYCVRVTVLDP